MLITERASEMAKEFRIAHAMIMLEGLAGSGPPEYFRSALKQSWVAGTQTTRYGRTWKLSKGTRPENSLWLGRMGFVKDGDLTTVEWDETQQDFIRGEASSGIVVPFIINDDHRVISFQLLAGKVRPKTVTSNLQSLLNVEGTHTWSIRPATLRKTLDQWLDSVHRLSTLNVQLTYPNPRWTGRNKVKDIMTTLNAVTVGITATADQDNAIDTQSDWFRQSIDHIRQGYGQIVLTGPNNETGDESKFVETAEEGGTVRLIDHVAASDDAIEVTIDDLKGKQSNLIDLQLKSKVVVGTNDPADDVPD